MNKFVFLNEKMEKRLSELKVGNKAFIRHFENDEIFEIDGDGLCAGEKLLLSKLLLLGIPVSIFVAGYTLKPTTK